MLPGNGVRAAQTSGAAQRVISVAAPRGRDVLGLVAQLLAR